MGGGRPAAARAGRGGGEALRAFLGARRSTAGVGLSTVVATWLCAAVALVMGPPASAAVHVGVPAHADVLSVTPADGSQLERAPTALVVVFSEDVNPAFVQVTLTGNDAAVPLGPPSVDGRTVTVTVPPGPGQAPGSYRLAYRVVSSDGHPVSGTSQFTVTGTTAATSATGPATSSPAVTTSPSGQAAGQAPAGSEPASRAPVLAGLVGVLAVAGAGLAMWRRRPER